IHMTNAPSGDALMDALLPYCNPSQEETLRKMKDMMRQMDKLRETMEMARQMQELFPEGENIADVDLEKIMELFMQTGNK
ncbi:MAG: hypothetical protein IKS85_06885, partial [Lachnospiraceae bacterium]|nr:hypothetical protein [Lachnospiraceae bacterium]